MKVLTAQQEHDHQVAAIKGGAKGILGGLAFALPAAYYLNKRSVYASSLPLSIKVMGVISVAVPACVICAERAGLIYDELQWSGTNSQKLATMHAREAERWKSMSTFDKLSEVTRRHQFSVIAGGWVASILGAYAWISRDKVATPFQKITQTRVWAQGLTVGLLISTAALTHGRARRREPDHSWQDSIQNSKAAEQKTENKA